MRVGTDAVYIAPKFAILVESWERSHVERSSLESGGQSRKSGVTNIV